MILGDTSTHDLHFMAKKFVTTLLLKLLNIVADGSFWFLCKTLIFLFLPFLTLVSPKLVYPLKTALDKPLLVQNLITSGNAISLWIRWIWNSLFWLGALWEQGKIGPFLSKVFEVWAKKYRGVIFHDTEHWCKIWIKPHLVRFQNRHEELGGLSLEHTKVQKLYIDGLLLSKAYTASVRIF